MTVELTDAGPIEAPAAPATLTARSRLVIALLLGSTFVVFLNETIMSVAIPHLMIDLQVSASAAQWLTTAFLLTMAVVIPITGFLIQRINTRPIFLLAMSIFSLGTLVCAISPGLPLLVFGRVVQATGTAIMMPLLMTTVMTLVPPQARGKIMGNISIVMSVAPAIGPTIAGLVLSSLDWRWMFILVLPIALIALVVGFMKVENVTTPRYAPLDILSVILSALGFGGLVYGLSLFGEGAGASMASLGAALVIGVAAVTMFVLRQMSLAAKDKALLDLRAFLHRNYTLSVSMMAVSMLMLFGSIILLPIYMQNVLKLSVLQAGLLLLPGSLLMGLLGPVVGRLYDRFGATKLLVPGSVLVSLVLWALTLVDQNTPVWAVLIGHVTISVGLAFVFTPLFTASLSSLPMQLYSHGSAILGSVQQVAGAAGVALFIALMSMRTDALRNAGQAELDALSGGIRTAFVCGAIISLVALGLAFFVRKPADAPGGFHGGH